MKKGGEFSIVGLVSLINLVMVNNMILIIMVGLLVKEIFDKYLIDNCKLVSLFDLFLCSV